MAWRGEENAEVQAIPGANIKWAQWIRVARNYQLRVGHKDQKDSNGKDVMEVEVPATKEDVDRVWAASRSALSHKPPPEKEHRDAATKQADHDRNSRTNVVLAWVGTNMYVRDTDGHLRVLTT